MIGVGTSPTLQYAAEPEGGCVGAGVGDDVGAVVAVGVGAGVLVGADVGVAVAVSVGAGVALAVGDADRVVGEGATAAPPHADAT